MILINKSYHKNDSSRELSAEIEYFMNQSMSLGICVYNDKEYYELMALLTEQEFIWNDGTSPSCETWGTSTSVHGTPLLIILRNYKITRSSYEFDSDSFDYGIDTIFRFSNFY